MAHFGKYFTLVIILLLCLQCKSDNAVKSSEKKIDSAVPTLPEEELKKLVFNCTTVDYIFKELPISISFGKDEGLETNIFFASTLAPDYEVGGCKSIARKIYNIGTEIYLEAEVYFDGNCHHYDFYKNGKLTYRSQITPQGISFYNNIILQAKQGPPSQPVKNQ